MTIDDATNEWKEFRKEQFMDCIAGRGTYGWLPKLQKHYCTLVFCSKDAVPYDCGMRGEILYRFTDAKTKDVTEYYECRRGEK